MASFNKVTYVDNETVIHAANLNAIQDSTLQNEADIDTLESGKVDKVTGKGLSTNDFTTEQLTKLSNLPTGAELETSLAGKVPTTRKINNKALSGDITLGAGDIGYDDTATYGDDTVGKNLKAAEGDIDELQTAIATKAEIDGSYESMTVGNAEQLVATVGVEDKVPYNFRTSGGSADIGDREVDEIVGGTIAWNQMMIKANSSSTQVGLTASATGNDGVVILTGTKNQTNRFLFRRFLNAIIGHKYLMLANKLVVGSQNTGVICALRHYTQISTNNIMLYGGVIINNTDATDLYFATNAGDVDAVYDISFVPMIFDLTQMFGSTIADYVYALEQANAGAGVAWFKKLFPKDYYAYDAGSLQSVNTSAHEMTGFNAFNKDDNVTHGYKLLGTGQPYADETCAYSNYIRVVSGATYYTTINWATGLNVIFYYDSDKNMIGKDANNTHLYIIPDNCMYVRLNMLETEVGTACFNLHWDGERDGEYEPYEKRTYPLDSDLTLRGIPKLDANNELYYDGDTYESDGTVTRRYGIVDLGTLNWNYQGVSQATPIGRFFAVISDCKALTGATGWNVGSIISTGKYTKGANVGQNNNDLKWGIYNASLYITDTNYTDKNTFKAAMSGVYLVYELATPTIESADPYQNPQWVDDFGTEEYVDAGVTAATPTRDVAIPVGHVTRYQSNLRAKLEMAPDSPDGDGDYIVRQTNGQNAYVPITFPADELPAAPTTDGNYMLKCAVSSGTATFTWEAIT